MDADQELNKESKGFFEGIVTLASEADAQEFVKLIDKVINTSVNVFYKVEKEGRAPITELLRDLNRLVQLVSGYPPLQLEDEDKQAAYKLVQETAAINKEIEACFAKYTGGKFEGRLGREVAVLMSKFLRNMVLATEDMDRSQIKRILRAVKKAFEVTVMMKDTLNDYRFEEKVKTFRTNMDSLIKNIDCRIDAIDNKEHIGVLSKAIGEVKDKHESLIRTTKLAITTPTQDNLQAQQQDLRTLLLAIQAIAGIIKLPPPRSRGGFDHETIINENLDHLRDAVAAGSAAATADAARKILDEVNRMAQDEPDPSEVDDEEARRRAREALEAAAKRLRDKAGGLLNAAKEALNNPDAEHQKALDDVIRDYKSETAKPVRQFDTIETTLKSSGMIDAAAKAADELANLFTFD